VQTNHCWQADVPFYFIPACLGTAADFPWADGGIYTIVHPADLYRVKWRR
jgi:hypothetical protein